MEWFLAHAFDPQQRRRLEPLSFRITQALPAWKRYVVYREVPASGHINVSLAMTEIGTVYFDDVRIEPLEPTAIGRGKP